MNHLQLLRCSLTLIVLILLLSSGCTRLEPQLTLTPGTRPGAYDLEDLPAGIRRVVIVAPSGNASAEFKPYFDILSDYYKDELLTLNPHALVYTHNQYDAQLIGSDDFKIPFHQLQTRIQQSPSTILAANLIDLQTLAPIRWHDKTFAAILRQMGDLKVGIIGLSDLAAIYPRQKKKFTGLYINDLKLALAEHVALLREQGAHLIVLLFQGDLQCPPTVQMDRSYLYITSSNPSYWPSCAPHSTLAKLLENLPESSIDGVIAAPGTAYHFIHRIPVIATPIVDRPTANNPTTFAQLELYYDLKTMQPLPERSRLYQPLLMTTPAQFLGHQIP